MKQTAVIIAPGRGTYNKAELGYLTRHHAGWQPLADLDSARAALGQETLTALDGAEKFSGARHTRGDMASPLIYACSMADYASVQDQFDILAVTGNSMGWYTALACAGALDLMGGFEVVNTMGRLMQEQMIGGQLIYPIVDTDWVEIPGERGRILDFAAQVSNRTDHTLALSINLGGFLVMAGNEAGLAAFEAEMPRKQDRYPMRLPNHAGFHTALQEPVAALGRSALSRKLFRQPALPLIDGRGAIWRPRASDLGALYDYTLGHQVVRAYDYSAAIRTAAREFMPDVFVILGPGTTLGGATAQALVSANWRGLGTKSALQADVPRVINLGDKAG